MDEVLAHVALQSHSHAHFIDPTDMRVSPPRVDDRQQLAVSTSERRAEGAMGKLMERIEKAAKSPEAKRLEKEMVHKAKDPKTRAKVSKGFRKLRSKH